MFLGYEYLKQGDLEKPWHLFEEQLRIDQELQFWDGIADGWRNLGNYAFFQREFDRAEGFYQKSLAVSNAHSLHQFDTLFYLGLVALHFRNFKLAYQRMAQSLEMVFKLRGEKALGVYLCGLATASAGANFPERALKLNAAGERIMGTAGEPYPHRELVEFNDLVVSARDQVGEDLVQTLTEQGKRMSGEEIVAYALADVL
jgi:tetratricopeptide (TPR) repeat protein